MAQGWGWWWGTMLATLHLSDPQKRRRKVGRGDRGWLKIEMGPKEGVSGGPTAKGVWLGSELVPPSSAAHPQAAPREQAVRREGGQVSNKGQMELPLWVGGGAGSAGRAHPWLIWGKPDICWAHTEPSSAEVPPPGKWSFMAGCMPASSSMGKKQGHDAQTDLMLGQGESGRRSQRAGPWWPSAPHVHARRRSRLLCTSAPWI